MAPALPQRLSATTVQALRDCPYRFFARVGLGLNEGDELDAALDNSDYGQLGAWPAVPLPPRAPARRRRRWPR